MLTYIYHTPTPLQVLAWLNASIMLYENVMVKLVLVRVEITEHFVAINRNYVTFYRSSTYGIL